MTCVRVREVGRGNVTFGWKCKLGRPSANTAKIMQLDLVWSFDAEGRDGVGKCVPRDLHSTVGSVAEGCFVHGEVSGLARQHASQLNKSFGDGSTQRSRVVLGSF